jgi:hypothetical protein
MAAKVYLDTNVYKFSATRLPRLRVEMREVNWGGRRQVLPLHVPVILDPNERIDETSVLRAETGPPAGGRRFGTARTCNLPDKLRNAG